ncbi:hypothetical protein BDZ85DRAFT_95261 [Elsinoe ampelina]|uniref:Uncharacterized protein n=1 Tax=Elsinoe ampelina TaxID=302913 RepID=A0A6A6GEA2_9PEZI|nr:hypothetical protein BDZ85DRAFT_95261 [Elsinoe ampelina]
MSSRVSKGKPATVQDVDEETRKTIPGTKVSANSDRSPPPKTNNDNRPMADTTSDSGRSNHTYETLASADSAKVLPRAPEPPKDKATNLPTNTAAIPPPTINDVPKISPTKKSSRASSPGKKHRRAESKSSKKSSEPVPVVYHVPGHCPCPDCDAQYRAYAYAAHYPPPHAAYAAPQHYYPPPAEVMPGADYALEPQPRIRRDSRPRPLSYHTAPPTAYDYALAAPTHLAGIHDPRDPYSQVDRRDYFTPVEGAVDILPTIRQSPLVSHQPARPIMPHAHTDYPVSHRHSTYAEYPPVFGEDDTFLGGDYSSSYGRRSAFPDQYFRSASRSPVRAGAEAYPRRSSRDDFSHPPLSMRIGRRPSVKQPTLEPAIESGRAPSRSRRDRSYTDLDSFRAMHAQAEADASSGRPSRAPSHSRRHSQYMDIPTRDVSKHSRSPGHRYTTSESRTSRPISYYSYDEQAAKQSKRRSRDVNLDSSDKYADARKYQEIVTGRKEDDELAKNVQRSYSSSGNKKPSFPGRVPSLRSAHSGRSHRSGRQSVDAGSGSSRRGGEDIQVQVKITQGGQTINKQKFVGSADLSINDDGELTLRDRSYHGSSARSTASVFSGFFSKSRRGSSGKDKDESGRESRRRSRVASPIIEDPRGERRESRRYN